MMNTSFLNTTQTNYINLLNKLIDSLFQNPILNLNSLSDAKYYKELLLEIEPEIEQKGSKIEISNGETYEKKYGNFLSIIKCIDSYFQKHSEKKKFSSNTFKIKKNLIIDDILKNDNDQLNLLSEILIFLCSITSKKELYLERCAEFDEMICNFFFVVIEKYIIIDTESINQSRSIMLDKSTLGLNTTMINRFDREKNNYMNVIKDQETQISNLKIQIENFEKKKIEFDNKLSEKDREIEILKNAQRDNNDIKEQLIQDTYTQSELINKLNSKEDEIEELKKQIDLIEKKGKDREKNLNLELYDTKEKLNDFEKLQNEYDKLKIKYKHLKEIYKNNEDSEKLQASLEQRLILTNKENLALKAQLEKITSELMKEKENIKNVELEKKKLEFKISDLGNEIKKLNENPSKKYINKNDQTDSGIMIGGLLDEIHKNVDNNGNEFINEYEMKEKDETIKRQNEENEKLINENISLQNKLDKLGREKDEIEAQLSKKDLDKQKISLEKDRIKNELKRIENDNKALNEKIKDITNTKQNEIEKIKEELKEKTDLVENILEEKKTYIKKYEDLQKDIETNIKANKIPKQEIIISNSEVLTLRNEIENLKLNNLQKDEEIRKITLKSKDRQLTDEEINTKLADLDFYKKSYEEQKARVNREHELISNSLYKLAVHFMGLKDDLQKKMKNK